MVMREGEQGSVAIAVEGVVAGSAVLGGVVVRIIYHSQRCTCVGSSAASTHRSPSAYKHLGTSHHSIGRYLHLECLDTGTSTHSRCKEG